MLTIGSIPSVRQGKVEVSVIRPVAPAAHIPVAATPVPALLVGRMAPVEADASVVVVVADGFNKRFLN